MNKDKLLNWLNQRMDAVDKAITRLNDEGFDDSEALAEYSVYQKIMHKVEDGQFE